MIRTISKSIKKNMHDVMTGGLCSPLVTSLILAAEYGELEKILKQIIMYIHCTSRRGSVRQSGKCEKLMSMFVW